MDEIFSIEEDVAKQYGFSIVNVSHWDSSTTFKKHMGQVLKLPIQSLPWDYYYTYSIPKKDREQVLKNLGVPSHQLQSTMGLLLQSSTISIVNMVNFLVHHNYKKLCVLQPAYFSVATCCSMLSLKYGTEQISFENGHPKIPVKKILSGGYDSVWITSPIFCTGYYPNEENIHDIASLKSAGMTLIFDESLALPGRELIRTFPIDEKTFAIYSPHKSISINGLKFSVIICQKCYEDFLEQWVDVFSGALSGSSRDAVFHYTSSNFINECFPAYLAYIKNTKSLINGILKRFPFASMLPNTEGHYISIFTDIKIKNKDELFNIIYNTIHTSMASFIPSVLNGFDDSQGFSFRVNLTGNPLEIERAVNRILQYFDSGFH